jgi:hypothetical protein
MKGIEMLLQASGIDLAQITKEFTALKDGVLNTLIEINGRLERLEMAAEILVGGETWQKIQHQQQQRQQKPQPAQPAGQRIAQPAARLPQ